MKFFALCALFAFATALPVDPEHLPGGLHKIELNDTRLVDLLALAQTDLNARMNSVHVYKTGKVIEAHSQIVSGVMYHLSFEFGETTCLKSAATTKEAIEACTGFEHVQVCSVRILTQAWTGIKEVTSFQCAAKAQNGVFFANEMPGGKHKLDVNDAGLLEIMTQSETILNEELRGMANGNMYHRITKVVEAESQVVNGVIYQVTFEWSQTQCAREKVTKETDIKSECNQLSNVQTCHATIHSQPWIKSLAIGQVQCQTKQAETHLDGGKSELAVDDAALLQVLAEAETKINKNFMGTHYQRIAKVVKAEQQVVSGILYHVTFEFDTTNCLKEKVTKDTDLKVECGTVSAKSVCQATILSQVWLKNVQVNQIQCQSGSLEQYYEEPIAGGKHKLDLHDETLLKTLTEVTPQVNDKLASTFFHRIGKVLSAESQVVSGVMYHLSFELGQTQCLKAAVTKDTNVATECSEFSHIQVCNAKIWSQPWLHHTEVTEVHCEARKLDVGPPTDIRGPTIPL